MNDPVIWCVFVAQSLPWTHMLYAVTPTFPLEITIPKLYVLKRFCKEVVGGDNLKYNISTGVILLVILEVVVSLSLILKTPRTVGDNSLNVCYNSFMGTHYEILTPVKILNGLFSYDWFNFVSRNTICTQLILLFIICIILFLITIYQYILQVHSFFHRELLSLAMIILALTDYKRYDWLATCLITMIFPLLPVVGRGANYFLVWVFLSHLKASVNTL